MPKLKSNAVMLEMLDGAVWKTIACITANGLESSSDDIDAGSKCGAETISGDLTWTAPIEGFFEMTPSSTQISHEALIALAQAQTEQQFRMRNADNSYYRSFFATLANYTENVDYNTVASFTADLNIRGTITTTPVS